MQQRTVFGLRALDNRALVAVAALVITFAVLRTPARDRVGRSLEAAAVVAAGPMVATYSWGSHLVLLLLPMLMLVAWGVRRRDWAVLASSGCRSCWRAATRTSQCSV